jgi:hypothetical protein
MHLSDAQVETLVKLDTKLRRVLQGIESRAALLPAGTPGAVDAKAAGAQLPELVERFLADAARDRAILIDPETAREFELANAAALAAKHAGDKTRWCPLCLAVRRGLEADFAWRADEHGVLSPEQSKEALRLAKMREDVRQEWSAGLKAELRPAQLAWIREAQMGWVKSTLHASVLGGMRTLGKEKCDACATKVEWKCEFCSIVLDALAEAKAKN